MSFCIYDFLFYIYDCNISNILITCLEIFKLTSIDFTQKMPSLIILLYDISGFMHTEFFNVGAANSFSQLLLINIFPLNSISLSNWLLLKNN